MTWTDLAIRLGTTRPSLAEWRKLDGAPESADIEAWAAFIESRGLCGTISIDDVTGYLTDLAAKLDLLLTQKMEVDLPVLCLGQPIAEIRAQCRKKHDEIRAITHAGLLNWTPES